MPSIINFVDRHNRQKMHSFRVGNNGSIRYRQRIYPHPIGDHGPTGHYTQSRSEAGTAVPYTDEYLRPFLRGCAWFPAGVALRELGRKDEHIQVN